MKNDEQDRGSIDDATPEEWDRASAAVRAEVAENAENAPQAGEDARPVGKLVVRGPLHEWHPENAAFDLPSGTHSLYATPQPSAQAAPAVPLTDLHKFYGVESDAALIAAQQRHIEKLQARMPSTPSLAPQRPREG